MRRACRNRGLTFVLRIEESLARERMIANISTSFCSLIFPFWTFCYSTSCVILFISAGIRGSSITLESEKFSVIDGQSRHPFRLKPTRR
jgi:hypothetical protein